MKVGPCIKSPGTPSEIASATASVASVAAKLTYPPVRALPRHIMSGSTPAYSQANIFPLRPNPVAISSSIKRIEANRAGLVANFAQPQKVFRVVEAHSPRALHDWLDYERGNFPRVFPQHFFELGKGRAVPLRAECWLRARGEEADRKASREHRVHSPDRVAHAHCVPSVAVVSSKRRRKFVFFGAPEAVPILQGHFHGDFHRDRSGIAKEHFLQFRRSHIY